MYLHTPFLSIESKQLLTYLLCVCVHLKEGGLGGLNYPLLADFHKTIARDYGVLIESAGIALRGLFIIDPQVQLSAYYYQNNTIQTSYLAFKT